MNKLFPKTVAVYACILLLAACGGNPPTPLPYPIQPAMQAEYRAATAYQEGRYALAIRHYQTALSHYRAIDRTGKQAELYINLARAALSINQLPLVEVSLAALDELILHNGLHSLYSHRQLLYSDYLLKTGKYSQAFELLDKLLNEGNNTLDQDMQQTAQINQAIAATRLKRENTDQLLARLQSSSSRQPLINARLLRLQADLALQQPENTDANANYQQALQIYREFLYQPGIAATLTEISESSIRQKKLETARHQMRRALSIRLYLADHHSAKKLLTRLIELENTLGNTQAADTYRRQLQRL